MCCPVPRFNARSLEPGTGHGTWVRGAAQRDPRFGEAALPKDCGAGGGNLSARAGRRLPRPTLICIVEALKKSYSATHQQLQGNLVQLQARARAEPRAHVVMSLFVAGCSQGQLQSTSGEIVAAKRQAQAGSFSSIFPDWLVAYGEAVQDGVQNKLNEAAWEWRCGDLTRERERTSKVWSTNRCLSPLQFDLRIAQCGNLGATRSRTIGCISSALRVHFSEPRRSLQSPNNMR